MGEFAKALTYYPEFAEGTSKEEFINAFACSVLVEKSGIFPSTIRLSSLEQTFSMTFVMFSTPLLTPVSQWAKRAKIFELLKRLDSLATDIFVGRAPTNDVRLANPSVLESHFRFISIPETKLYYQHSRWVL